MGQEKKAWFGEEEINTEKKEGGKCDVAYCWVKGEEVAHPVAGGSSHQAKVKDVGKDGGRLFGNAKGRLSACRAIGCWGGD